MAAFATMEAAEIRARAKMEDGTWFQAHAARNFSGAIIVRFQRKMSPTNPAYGEWVETTDDATV
jgi:hypothetical protein